MAKKEYKYYRSTFLAVMPDGTKKQMHFTGKTQREADRKCAAAKAEYEAGLIITNGKTTFAKWVDEWIETYKRPNILPYSVKEIERVMNKYFVPIIGAVPLSELRSNQVQKCVNGMAGKSERYIKKSMGFIKDCIKCAPEGTLRYNPIHNLKAPRAKKARERRPLTEAEKAAFFEVVQSHRYGAFFGLLYACGLRPQEARAMQLFSVDLEKKRIHVIQAVEAGTLRDVKEPKSNAGKREIPVPDWYMPLLQKQVEQSAKAGSPYLFQNRDGNILGETTVRRAWNDFKTKMNSASDLHEWGGNLPDDLEMYDLRHDCCTRWIRSGIDLKTVQYMMGHADIRITMDIYAHVTEEMVDHAAKKIALLKY